MSVISGVLDLRPLSDVKSGVLRLVMSGIEVLDIISTDLVGSGVAQSESRVSVEF